MGGEKAVGGYTVLVSKFHGASDGRAKEGGTENGLTVDALNAPVVEKGDLLWVYSLMRDQLRALYTAYLTFPEVFEHLTPLALRAGRVRMASHHRAVL